MLSFISAPDIPSSAICSVLNFYIVLLHPAKMEVLPIFYTELRMAGAVTHQKCTAHTSGVNAHID